MINITHSTESAIMVTFDGVHLFFNNARPAKQLPFTNFFTVIRSFLGFVFLVETFLIFQNTIIFPIEIENNALNSFITFYSSNSFIDWITSFQYSFSSNIKVLGFVLYTDYVLFFLLAGAILLIALLGAIILTMQSQENVVRQEIYQQLSRNAKHAVFVADMNNK